MYAWTPKGSTATKSSEEASAPNDPTGPPSSSKPYLVYSCCGDKAVLPLWLRNGPRQFDLWATYYGNKLCGNQPVSGAPDNSSLSHFSAMTRPPWLGRAVKEPASPRHRAGIASMAWRTTR